MSSTTDRLALGPILYKGVGQLQDELEEARKVLEENIDALERLRQENDVLNDEKEDLIDQLDAARLELEAQQRDADRERTASRTEARVDRETLEEINALRDKLAATEIELQTKVRFLRCSACNRVRC